MSSFLIRSLVLSAVLTLLLNLFLGWRARRVDNDPFGMPGGSRSERPIFEPPPLADHHRGSADRPRVRVFVPWKAMLIASIGLTVVLNLVAWLAR